MPQRKAPLSVTVCKRTGKGARSGRPGCGRRFFHAARYSRLTRMKLQARRPSHPLTLRAIGKRDAYHRATASNPTVCSGSVQSLSRRVARTPKERSGALAFAAGVRRHPTL